MKTRRAFVAMPFVAGAGGAAEGASRYRIEVRKGERQLVLFTDGEVSHRFRVSLGFAPEGTKLRQGDGRTPEGEFHTVLRNRQSSYYRSVMIDYPLPADAHRGFHAGLIDAAARDAIVAAHRRGAIPPQNTRLGGDIFIHGGGNTGDWTLGCIALANRDMDVLFALPTGVRVRILR